MDESALVKELQERSIPFAGRIEKTSWVESSLLGWLLPIGILMLVGAIKDVAAAAAGVAIAVWIAVVCWEDVKAARLLLGNAG